MTALYTGFTNKKQYWHIKPTNKIKNRINPMFTDKKKKKKKKFRDIFNATY
jgi:hypothetical protein